jgi:hypothetical protein
VEGVKSCYCINWKVFNRFRELLTGFSNALTASNEKHCC